MEFLPVTIAAGETKRFELAGRYLEIIRSAAPMTLRFSDRSGGLVAMAKDVISGVYLNREFVAFEMYSADAQSVVLFISDGEGGSRRQPGEVSITNRISSSTLHVEAGGPTAIGLQVVEVIAPADNVRGILIRQAGAVAIAGVAGTAELRIMAAPVTPVTAAPAQSYAFVSASSTAEGVEARGEPQGHQSVEVPPAWGVYVVTNHKVAVAQSAYAFDYELL